MESWLKRYATGEWLTLSLMFTAGIASLTLCLGALLLLFVTATGDLDMFGRALGTDYSGFWSAGRMAVEGRASEVYNWSLLYDFEQQKFGASVPLTVFAYPPSFLLLTAVLALLPYLLSFMVWQLATLAPTVWLVARILPDRIAVLLAISSPAVLRNLAHGQNGCLTAFLLGAGLWQLDRRPVLSGVLFGCLVYKPHLGLVVPLLLIVRRSWLSFSAAGLTALFIVLVSVLAFGTSIWQIYLDSLPFFRHALVDSGAPGYERMQSAFATVRMWGGSLTLAYLVQTSVTVAVLSICAYLVIFSSANVRNAAVCAAAVLVTPFVLDYDLVLIGLGIVFIVADGRAYGFRDWEKTTLALIWIMPGLSRALAESAMIPGGPMASLALLALAIARHRTCVMKPLGTAINLQTR
jgi:hypothetical protein